MTSRMPGLMTFTATRSPVQDAAVDLGAGGDGRWLAVELVELGCRLRAPRLPEDLLDVLERERDGGRLGGRVEPPHDPAADVGRQGGGIDHRVQVGERQARGGGVAPEAQGGLAQGAQRRQGAGVGHAHTLPRTGARRPGASGCGRMRGRMVPELFDRLPEQYFTRILAAVAAEAARKGPRVVDLGRGDPDLPPPAHAI